MKLTSELKAKIKAHFDSITPEQHVQELVDLGFTIHIDAPSKATTKEPSTDAAHLKKENR